MDRELERLILRLARENPRWGYGKIEGELLKLGYEASRTAIRNVLKRHSIVPAPVRSGSIGWRRLMTHYKERIPATFYSGNNPAKNPICVFSSFARAGSVSWYRKP
jgi:hypothetical protein